MFVATALRKLRALLLITLAFTSLPVQAACEGTNLSLGPVIDATTTRPARFDWQGDFLQDDVICYLSRQSGAELRGYLFAPANVADLPDGSLPVVVIGTGSGSAQALYYIWAARELAGHGYLVLAEDPQGAGRSEIVGDPASCGAAGCKGVPFQSSSNFVDGLVSALDFIESRQHAWLAKADLTRIGLAGHSLSARAASFVGGVDLRVDAVVGFDNMSSTLQGDAGVSSGGGDCGALIGGEVPGTPTLVSIRVPTMGQAADRQPGCEPTNLEPELKKTGFLKWRAAGVPSMLVDFRDAVHDDWAQTRQSVPQQLESFQYYTRGWFDLYLKGDETARARLLSPMVKLSAATLPITELFSTRYRSAVFMPEARIDCTDLLALPCVPTPLPLPPVISKVLDQLIDEDGVSGPVSFTLSDADTAVAALTVQASSSNTALLPQANITLEGSGAMRSLTMLPAPNQSGFSTLTLTVSDGSSTAATAFVLTVNAINDAPEISALPDQSIDEDGAGNALGFTLSDVDSLPEALSVQARSSNTALLPDGGMVLDGSGAARSLMLTPAANRFGTSTVTLTASDGVTASTQTLVLTVNAINDAPTITRIADQTIEQDAATGALAFSISDLETEAAALSVTATSSNSSLVTSSGVQMGGSTGTRTIKVTPAAGQAGSANISLTVSDGSLSSTTVFGLTVQAASTGSNPPPSTPPPVQAVGGRVATAGSGGAIGLLSLLPLMALAGFRRRRQWLPLLAVMGLVACGNSAAPLAGIPLPIPGGNDLLACVPITLPTVQGAGSAIDGPPPAYDWQGEWQSCEVIFPSKAHGSALYGVLFAPKNLSLASDRLPTVVIAPGSATGLQSQYQWSARDLAGHGYIVLSVDPQGVGRSELVSQPQTADNYIDAVVSALDYLLSAQNPLQDNVDASRMGAAGHSLSARVLSFLQGEDSRIQAIVAWDNLSSTVEGDAGISSGGGVCGSLIGGEVPLTSRPATPRVPAMGQASDAEPGCDPTNTDPELKKTAYSVWREAGVSSMQIVVLGKGHADWAQSPVADASSESPKSKELQLFQHYTRAWFDLWLKKDTGAIKALTATQVFENTPETIFSVDFRSALYLPHVGIDCPDILTGGCPAFTP